VKNRIRPPVKVDQNKRVIRSPNGRAHWWRLNVPASLNGGSKLRLFFKTEKDAKAHAEGLLEAHTAVSPDLLGQLRTRGMTISDAIRYALKHAPLVASVDLESACVKFHASRRAKNCKPRYLAVLKSDIDSFEEEFPGRTVDSLSKSDIERYLASLTAKDGETPASPKTRRNVLASVSAFLNYAVEEGWRGENPALKIAKPILDATRPAILLPDQVEKLLEAASRPEFADIFPAVLLQLFAGPRRSEIPHLTWDHIKDRYLRLDLTKTRDPRAVEMPEALLQWMATLTPRAGRILALKDVNFDPRDTRGVEDAYTYRVSQLAEVAKVVLPKNVLRHTAITYREALTNDLLSTARWAGHTAEVLERYYRGAATRADAEKFYSLRPPARS
jgi:site-specific recombinase XerD